jgi:nucleotide-binding universal stress UspA family protein
MPPETVVLAVGREDEHHADRLAEVAAGIAGPAGATILVTHVLTEKWLESVRERLDVQEGTPHEAATHQPAVSAVRELLEETSVAYDIHGRICGDETIGEGVVAVAVDADADLVIAGGSGRSPAGKALFGSTSQEILLNAPCPVTFVRAG